MNITIPLHLLNRAYCHCSGITATNCVFNGISYDDAFNVYDGCAFE